MKTELHDYDIFPKVVPSGKETQITIKPLGRHAAFPPQCTLSIHPMDEGRPLYFPDRPNVFEYEVSPEADGCIRFIFRFFGEQQFHIRLTDGKKKLQLCVYAVGEDLVGLYPFRGDLHLHSFRSDGREAPEIVAAEYRKTGYDFMAITDHHRYYPSIEAIEAYKGAPIELTLVPGEEIQLINDYEGPHINEVHIINFGGTYSINALVEDRFTEEIADKAQAIIPNPPKRMTAPEYWAMIDEYAKTLDIPENIERYAYASCHWIFAEIRKSGGLGIFAHPYWISNVIQIPPTYVDYMMENHPFDAFEVLGGELYFEQNGFQTIQYYEDRAKGRSYSIVGSTDSHMAVNNPKGRICATIVFAKENERVSLMDAIRAGHSVAVDTISAEPRYVGELRLVRYAVFLDKEFFPLHDALCFEEGRAMKDYVCGEPRARETLAHLYGRVKAQREKYFAF